MIEIEGFLYPPFRGFCLLAPRGTRLKVPEKGAEWKWEGG